MNAPKIYKKNENKLDGLNWDNEIIKAYYYYLDLKKVMNEIRIPFLLIFNLGSNIPFTKSRGVMCLIGGWLYVAARNY